MRLGRLRFLSAFVLRRRYRRRPQRRRLFRCGRIRDCQREPRGSRYSEGPILKLAAQCLLYKQSLVQHNGLYVRWLIGTVTFNGGVLYSLGRNVIQDLGDGCKLFVFYTYDLFLLVNKLYSI